LGGNETSEVDDGINENGKQKSKITLIENLKF